MKLMVENTNIISIQMAVNRAYNGDTIVLPPGIIKWDNQINAFGKVLDITGTKNKMGELKTIVKHTMDCTDLVVGLGDGSIRRDTVYECE